MKGIYVQLPTVEDLADAITKFGPKTYAYGTEPTSKWIELVPGWEVEDVLKVACKLRAWLAGDEVQE